MNPPDLLINYKTDSRFILSCWEVRWLLTPEIMEKRLGVENWFNHAFNLLFTAIITYTPNVLFMSNYEIQVRISRFLILLDIPEWAKTINFQISRGKHHPYKDSS